MTELKINLGKRIKYLRKSKNITQEQLAEIINMDITTLSKIETGRNYPQPETIEKLASALEVDIDKLFTFNDEFTSSEYLQKINQNLLCIKDNDLKLKLLYKISSAMI